MSQNNKNAASNKHQPGKQNNQPQQSQQNPKHGQQGGTPKPGHTQHGSHSQNPQR